MQYKKHKYEVLGPIRITRKGNFNVGDTVELNDSEYFHLSLLYKRRLKKVDKVKKAEPVKKVVSNTTTTSTAKKTTTTSTTTKKTTKPITSKK